MANEQNLKPFDSNQNREEAKKNGRKGGIASGIARRKKKKYQEIVDIVGNLKLKDKKVLRNLKENFELEEDKEICNDMAIVMRIYDKAIKKSDIPSAVFIRNTRGEAPVIKKAQTTVEGKDVPIIKDDIK